MPQGDCNAKQTNKQTKMNFLPEVSDLKIFLGHTALMKKKRNAAVES